MRWLSVASSKEDLRTALDECVGALQARLASQPPHLLVVFISRHHRLEYHRVVPTLSQALSPSILLGCSAGGVIGGGRELEQRPGVTLTAAILPGVEGRLVHLHQDDLPALDGSPRPWIDVVGVSPQSEPVFLVLADPFGLDAPTLLQGLDYAYPRAPKVGGLASAAQAPAENALFSLDATYRSGALVLALCGDVALDTIVAQGCRPVGRLLRVTACEDHMLQGLDGRPPLEWLQELHAELGPRDRDLLRKALFLGLVMDGMREEVGPGDFLIRNVLGMEPREGSLAVGAELRPGQRVQFHVRDRVAAAGDLSAVLGRYRRRARQRRASGALLFSCVGRGVHLFGRPDHDSRLFQEEMGPIPLGGFFCNGEIGPIGGSTYVHGYTSSFGLFRPKTATTDAPVEG